MKCQKLITAAIFLQCAFLFQNFPTFLPCFQPAPELGRGHWSGPLVTNLLGDRTAGLISGLFGTNLFFRGKLSKM